MSLKLAILDLYNGTKNQGMRCIKDLVSQHGKDVDFQVFDVRKNGEVPNLDFDIYISSGGPGSPINGEGLDGWEKKYSNWLDDVWNWNQQSFEQKKHVLFICHSFQMACNHFKLGSIVPRKSMSFGTFPVHKTDAGIRELIFDTLADPFYVADFRRWQFIQPDMEQFKELGAEILALEKIRPHVPLERAIMAVRFSPEMIGVQFHPEADPDGMTEHFKSDELREEIIKKHGEDKYHGMMRDLRLPDRIAKTHDVVIPSFLERAIEALNEKKTELLMAV
ncbi:MAG: GMP synthase [Bacteroidota bacterium]